MSGIVGVFNLSGEPVRRETIISMCDAINHRGPHGRGIWTDGPVGFGHVLLHTTEESLREKQPLSQDGQTWITADARIDDREGLIDLLKSHVHSSANLQKTTDNALLLHAYHVWGVECVHHLTGVFAAAIWDGRKQQLVFLRDHIGIKPFYYAQTPERLIFASEVKGVLASGLIPRRIYEPRIADYLVSQLEGIDKTCTFFEGVVRLPPAHRMLCNRDNTKSEEYWRLAPTRELCFKDQREYIEAFFDQFYKAVHCRLRGNVSVASMLSGGIDSSSIVAVARDILAEEKNQKLRTFSVINREDPNCLETSNIDQVLSFGRIESFYVDVEDTRKYFDDLLNIWHTTDDLFDYYLKVPQITYLAAHHHGITAMLDGVDGDLVIGQPGNHIAYLLQRYHFIAAIREAIDGSNRSSLFPGSIHANLYYAFRGAFTPNFLRLLRKRSRQVLSQNTLKNEIKDTIINHDFATKINLLDRINALQQNTSRPDQINLRLNHAEALNHPNVVVALERYDRVASKYSIEPRHPILDKRLIEFCLALPWEQKTTKGWTKIIMRRSMRGLLPESVISRRGKEHLGPKIMEHILSNLIGPTQKTLTTDLDSISHYVDVDKVKSAYIMYKSLTKSPRKKEELKLNQALEGLKLTQAIALLAWSTRWRLLNID